MTANAIWADLMAGNERFCNGAPQARDLVRERRQVAQSPHPKAMVLTCADSRVAPEIIFDQCLGDLFVVRIAGNVADKLALGSLEFGASDLGIGLLVVIGHQHCLAVKAAVSGEKSPSANIKAIFKSVRSSQSSFDPGPQDEGAQRKAEQENARHVARTVLERSDALRDCVQRGELAVVPAYYRVDDGVVERL